MQHMRIP